MTAYLRANISSNSRDLSRPFVMWKRAYGSYVWHACVESAEMSWIQSGKTACHYNLTPAFVLVTLPGRNEHLCARCVRALETAYPLTEVGQ